MLTNLLYERRFGPYFVFALVIGLDPKTGETFVYDSDNIGAISDNVNLATIGTASEYIFGLSMFFNWLFFSKVFCIIFIGELFFKPDMNADELFEATSQALLNGMDRDSASGWGAVVYVVEKDKITLRELKGRQD
jgi:20S proteasome subunit beta 3